MASFASSATTGGARKHAWTKKKVGVNNGQLRFVRNHGWCTQARLDQKVDENNGQLRFVRHHGWRTQARLDQNVKVTAQSILWDRSQNLNMNIKYSRD